MEPQHLIAIGRSRYLYDAIRHLHNLGYAFSAIITDEAYPEYDVKAADFEMLAHSVGARFFQTRKLQTADIVDLVREDQVRVAISANWKYTIPASFIDLFDGGILNFHLGNLPDYKGNATVNWSIINGEPYINANIHKMDPVLDAGDVICRFAICISHDSYISDILAEAEQLAPLLFEQAVKKALTHPGYYEIKGTTDGLRCYPRLPEDSQIDWRQDVQMIHRLVRASAYPYNGAFTFLHGEKVIVWKACPLPDPEPFLAVPGHVIGINKLTNTVLVACSNGVLQLEEIEWHQKRMPPALVINSIRTSLKYKADV